MQKRQVFAQVGACVARNGRPGVRLGSPRRQRRSVQTATKLATHCTLECRRSGSKFLAGLTQHHVGCRARDHKMWTFVVEGGTPFLPPAELGCQRKRISPSPPPVRFSAHQFSGTYTPIQGAFADAVPPRFGFYRRLKIGESPVHSPPSTTRRPPPTSARH